MLVIAGLLAVPVLAASVGTFIQVEGTVEVLHQGRPPAIPAKVRDGVSKGDQVRTKSQSRAQVRFVDETVLTISPGSSVLIEDYLYDAPQGYRQADLHLFRGLAYTVVNRVFQTEKPDFVMKTHTAVFGVRGTRFFTLAAVSFSGNYLEQGAGEMTALTAPGQAVRLNTMGFAVAQVGQALVKGILTPVELDLLRQWLITGVPQNVLTGEPPFISSLKGPGGPDLPGVQRPKDLEKGLFVPPPVAPAPVSPPSTHHYP
ncbi:MAG: FecR family protein [Desulfobaccales bacterium]